MTDAESVRLSSGSYRNLLGTAETIVDMDEQMRDVEAHVTDIGASCNLKTLDGKVAEMKKSHSETRAQRMRLTCQ